MFLGLDIGTSGVKAVLVDEDQNIIEQTTAPLTSQRPHTLWSEQNPRDWWEATSAAVKSLSPTGRDAVKAIGLAGQMHGATCLGENDHVLRPAILWNDGRSHTQCEQMMADMPSLPSIAGNLAMPGFTAPKLVWLREHEHDTFKKIKKILLPKDYVRLLMSGDYASDLSDSAGTLWMDVEKRTWSDEILSLTGLSRDHMPKLYEGNDFTGELKASVAADWGLPIVPIAAGGGDNAAGAVGVGTVDAGDGFLSLGTSGVIFLADKKYNPRPETAVHTFCHALPDRWHQMSVILSAASAVDFVSKITGFSTPADLYAAAEALNSPSKTLQFLPYLSGERTPHNNPNAKGAFFGLTHEDDKNTMAQAALEGVAFALADGLDALRDAGASIEALSVIGGGARSQYWGKILASSFAIPLHYRDGSTVGPAYGAARLARLALKQDSIDTVCQPPKLDFTIEPDTDLQAIYSEKRKTFKTLYTQTKDLS